MTDQAVSHFISQHPSITGSTAPWLDKQRHGALNVLRDLGFPHRRQEDWRYTDVGPILKRTFSFNNAVPEPIAEVNPGKARIAGLVCHELVFINGVFSPSHSNIEGLDDKIRITSLGESLRNNEDWMESYLNRHLDVGRNGFIALNTAYIIDGAVIHVPDDTVLDKPVNIIHWSHPDRDAAGSNLRNLIVLGRHAKAGIIETWCGPGDEEYFNNTLSEIVLGEGAALEHTRLQEEGNKAFHIGYTQVYQERDSRLDSNQASLGGKLSRSELVVRLAGQGAECNLNGFYMAGKSQLVDHHTQVDHLSPHTGSNEVYRGVMDGRSRGVFNGRIIVHKDAQKTAAHLSNANLLLSGNAEVDTKPELEIYADDVKCSHGATVGRLDEQMLFYLRTRAIDEDVARSLLTFAFAGEVIQAIPHMEIRSRLQEVIAGRLPDAEQISEFIK